MRSSLSEYFAAADIVAISTLRHASGYRFYRSRTGTAGSIWVEAKLAAKVIREANRLITIDRCPDDLQALLVRAATACGARPTPHHIVLDRAERTMREIDEWIRTANASGTLGAFNREYRRQRETAEGHGTRTMKLSTARHRLRQALIRRLISGAVVNAKLLQEVFPCPTTQPNCL